MDPSGQAIGGLNAAVEGENCLKEIANNYVEEEDGENSSGGEESGGAGENGIASSAQVGYGRGGRQVSVGNGTDECRDSGDDSGNDGGGIEVSSDSSGEEHSGESEEDGDDEDEEGDEEEEEAEEEADEEEKGEGVRGQNHGTSDRGSRGTGAEENGFVGEHDRERCSAEAEEMDDDVGGVQNGVEAAEKSLTESEGGGQSGGTQVGRTLRRRRGRPLNPGERKSSSRAAPITPKLEEPRAVRVNRGMKRRFPGTVPFSLVRGQ